MEKDYRFIPFLYKENTLYKPGTGKMEPVVDETSTEQENTENNPGIDTGVMVVTQYKDAMPPEDKQLLLKILGAVNLTESDVHIAGNTGHNSLKELFATASNLRQVLFFGIRPAEAGLQGVDIPKYQMGQANNLYILTADSLPEIATSKEKKKALWLNLQRMFGIS